MGIRQWLRPPRRLLVLFLGLAVVPAVALGWLGWRMLAQDRALELQRIQERLEDAADLAGAQLRESYSRLQARLAPLVALPQAQLAGTGDLGEDAVLVVIQGEDLEAYPAGRLLYYPQLPAEANASPEAFAASERLELVERDYLRASEAYRQAAAASDPQMRAGAWLRLGRTLRKAGRFEEALTAYQELARLEGVRVAGQPAELLARHARCALLQQLRRNEEHQREANGLADGLRQARWKLTRGAHGFYVRETSRWAKCEPDAARLALAAGVEALWEEWQRIRRGGGSPAGARVLWLEQRSVLLSWRATPERLAAAVAGPGYAGNLAGSGAEAVTRRRDLVLALSDGDGHVVIGDLPKQGVPQAVRTAAETGSPWTLHLASADPSADLAALARRGQLLFGGLALLAALLLTGGYFVTRAVTRELEVARLKSDFVSAVSHEFRSPLTTLRQLTENLERGRVPSEERRERYYRLLSRETARLHRLVEGLLNFGRMEAGATRYRLEPVDALELVRAVVAEFQEEVRERGYRVELSAGEAAGCLQADREALGRALWNLLDNAVKYSPGCQTVWVDVVREASLLLIRVRDRGVGLAPAERQTIFGKFVRGAAAEATGAKGAGIGLAMVAHTVQAHGGEIRVESQPGQGSAFTMALPVEE